MLKARIISTLRFFDLQDWPLTLLELHKFLIADLEELTRYIDGQGELKQDGFSAGSQVSIEAVLNCLDSECQGLVESSLGFYYLPGRKSLVEARLNNYFYGINREKLIKKYIGGLKYLPFLRGAALAGSQAMGEQKPQSDIDLLIVAEPKFLWLARTLVTAYFHVLGKRRYGFKIANRFCLNHYLAGPKTINSLRNLYTAAEYLKLRPLVFSYGVWEFQQKNSAWIKSFFPNAAFLKPETNGQPGAQKFLEKLFLSGFGRFVERILKNWQLPKIRREKFIVVEEDELSFHPQSKQQNLLLDFFKLQKQE